MKSQLKSLLVVILASVTIFSLPVFLYITFVTFKPEIPKTHKEVKGVAISFLENIPFPQDARIVSEDTTADGQTATMETKKTPEDVQKFYEIVLASDGWVIETKSQNEEITMAEYKKGKKRIKITAGTNQKTTLATISLSQI